MPETVAFNCTRLKNRTTQLVASLQENNNASVSTADDIWQKPHRHQRQQHCTATHQTSSDCQETWGTGLTDSSPPHNRFQFQLHSCRRSVVFLTSYYTWLRTELITNWLFRGTTENSAVHVHVKVSLHVLCTLNLPCLSSYISTTPAIRSLHYHKLKK